MNPVAAQESVLVEVAGGNDVELILPLVEAFCEHFHYPFVREEKRAQLAEFVATPALGRLLAIRCRGSLIGYALIAFSFGLEFGGRLAFIDELWVMPSARCDGVGGTALAQIEAVSLACGMRALRLEVDRGNERVVALYARTGYTDHHRRLLTKKLNP